MATTKAPAQRPVTAKKPAARQPSGTKPAGNRSAPKEPPATRSPRRRAVRTAPDSAGRHEVPLTPTPLFPEDAPWADTAEGADRGWPNAPVRRSLGVALLGLAGAGRFAAGAAPMVPGPGGELPAEPVMDVALGLLDVVLEAGERVSATVRRHVNPVLQRAWAPARVPVSGTAGTGLRVLGALTEPLAKRGRRLRADSEHEAAAAVASVLPETIQLVMEQLDLTELALDHVDLQRVLEATTERIDFTGFAIDHVDLERVIEASFDQVDFTGMAISRLDFARAVTAALEQVDVLSVARDQLDPARVAAYLRDNVDVVEAIRAAPGAVTTEAVRNVRQTMGRLTGR